ATIIPSVILPSVTAEAPIPTITITPTQEVPTLVPTPNGGADLIVLLSGNEIISMNLDGNRPEPVDAINIEKANLQWINNGLLIYISPTRNCAYVIDVEEKKTNEVICFRLDEKLEGFRISSDGKYVAIGVARTLHIVPFDMEFFESINTRYTRFLLENIENGCHYDLPVKDVRWSDDGRRIAALVVDTQQANSDQIHLFEVDLLDCNSRVLIPTDKFPANRFSFASTTIPSYDWDGKHYFLINDFIRNNGFGNLYLYNSENHKEEIINPINGACCYRDARWSPDGEYILFLYQNEFESEVMLYYIPTSALDTDEMLTPIEIPPGLLKSRDKPQPVLIPAQ
ncbi:MAG TPA: hypothetical protein VLA72_00080, partial [Anaerolineales bacterium]|nr:hypothetical protein [Anaerolineales bacterium]